MLFRLTILFFIVVTVAIAAEPVASRPKNCTPGTTYKKDCNTCTCSTSERLDRCSRINCERNINISPKRPPTKERPGTCPTVAKPPVGNTDCSRRKQTSQCKLDTECSAAKKCCKNGCGIYLCRNAIYSYNDVY